MTKARSVAEQEYRQAVATYVEAVMIARDWSRKDVARAAGIESHTTIGRWLKAEVRADFGAVSVLEQNSSVPIPDELKRALSDLRRSEGIAPTPARVGEALDGFKQMTPEEREEFLRQVSAEVTSSRG